MLPDRGKGCPAAMAAFREPDRPGSGPDRYRLAGELLADRGVLDDVLVSAASAHATLVLAVGTAMAGDFGNHAEPAHGAKLPRPLTRAARAPARRLAAY